MAKYKYLGEQENFADLVYSMPEDLRVKFKSYGHLSAEAAFHGRLFVVYKPCGVGADNRHRPPNVLGLVKVLSLSIDPDQGPTCEVECLNSGRTMVVTTVPRLLFEYPVFISLPVFMGIRWDALPLAGNVSRSLSWGILLKTKNRSDYFSAGNTYCETPNKFRVLYPDVKLDLPQ